MTSRDLLKKTCLQILDERAQEHPAGHQGKLAARYNLFRPNGEPVELMFEKGPERPANVWVAQRHVAALLQDAGLDHRLSPASIVNARKDKTGNPIYGRHSALKPMRELGQGDLVCFRIEGITQLTRILDHLEQG